jgi:hypothetical protein
MTETILPVRAVTLFSSGVAFVLHEGEVPGGEAETPLTFRTPQVKDILKSLVLLDESGSVQPAVYPSQDPIERTLASFAVNVAGNVTQADLLRQLRGTVLKVELEGGDVYTGRLIGVEARKKSEVLTILTDSGMVAVKLSRCREVSLLDERRDRELREALAVLSGGSDEARRTLTLRFSGEKSRMVRVGYVTEAPLWKVSYRLVLGDGKPYLQGWALVENTTDEDWSGVALSLVSGRPVSFIQDLYQPLYVPRPVVENDLGPTIYPQSHEGAMALAESSAGEYEVGADLVMGMPAPAPTLARSRARAAVKSEALSQSVQPQASGESKGELFAYEISTPVTLPRQQAAMIPVVSEGVEGEKLSLYDGDSAPKNPLNAVLLKNKTNLHLKSGPVTLFDDGIYAGDARMEDVPPGDERLLTYAVDLAIEGERIREIQQQRITRLKLRRGVLAVTLTRREESLFRFVSKAEKERVVLLEYPFLHDWRLVTPDTPAERTRERYRFRVSVPAGGKGELRVATERTDATSYQVFHAEIDALMVMADGEAGNPALKSALEEVGSRRRSISELESEANAKIAEVQRIHTEQERIRQNLAAVERGTPLARRYLSELESQEDRLATLGSEVQRLQESARAASDALRAWLDDLEVSG